jgi:hypothetical protein
VDRRRSKAKFAAHPVHLAGAQVFIHRKNNRFAADDSPPQAPLFDRKADFFPGRKSCLISASIQSPASSKNQFLGCVYLSASIVF